MSTRPGATAIVLTDPRTRPPDRWSDARIVHTPLDLIIALDDDVDVVVLVGTFAREPAICGFLHDSYPLIDVVAPETLSPPRAFPRGSMCAIPVDTTGDAAGCDDADPIEPRYS
jgi:hypothetical protein